MAPSFGELLRQHRLLRGLPQEALAERAQLSVETISALERGTRQRPYRATIALLVEALELSSDDRQRLERAARVAIPAAGAPKRTTSVAGANTLPAHISSFVGREGDIANVNAIIENQRLVTLVGAGGVGKTRLALHAVENVLAAPSTNERRDGVWFVDLSPYQDGSMIPAAIASSMGLKQSAGLDPLIAYLRNQRFLLILDNCEHLLDAAANVAQTILLRCPNAQILATSRQALSLDGERVYRVPPLSVPPNDDRAFSVTDALQFGAIRLFVDRAQGADARFELTEATIPAIADICRRLDGIALAIELVAARTTVFSPSTMAKRLTEHFLALTGGSRAPLPRHKTMRALFDWSYELLDDRERYVFRRLSVFVGGFTFELATAVCSPEIGEEATEDVLASLFEKSLVQSDVYVDPPRYRLLEPARHYARERLREHGELDVVDRAHAAALLTIVERFDAKPEITSDQVLSAYVDPERENFRVAIEWALGSSGDAQIAQRLAGSKWARWFGSQSGELQHWVRDALKTCDETTPLQIRAKLELVAARVAVEFIRTDARAALAAVERALTYQHTGDLPGMALAQAQLGWELIRGGRYNEAEAILREAVATARSCNAQYECAYATQALALAREQAGDLEAARDLVLEAVEQYRSAGSTRLAMIAATTLAEVEFSSGQTETALRLMEEASEFHRTHGDWPALSVGLSNLSAYSLGLGRYDEARSHARESLLLARKIGISVVVSCALQHLAAAAVLKHDRIESGTAELKRSASILGFVDESLTRIGILREPTEQQEYEKVVAVLLDAFGKDELENLMASGKQWPEEQAVTKALMM